MAVRGLFRGRRRPLWIAAVAAILLATQLFLFGVEQRSKELGLFTAVGLRPKQVKRLFFAEAAVLTN